MQKIFKYALEITDVQKITLPKCAEILTVGVQDEHAYLWAKVDPEADTEERTIFIYGTGNPIYEIHGVKTRYIGTVFDNSFVWHFFEEDQRKVHPAPAFDTRYLTGP